MYALCFNICYVFLIMKVITHFIRTFENKEKGKMFRYHNLKIITPVNILVYEVYPERIQFLKESIQTDINNVQIFSTLTSNSPTPWGVQQFEITLTLIPRVSRLHKL